ncbi:MAG: hypothetical protein ACPHM0_04235 [Flavobacteriales bacterium]
MQHTSTPLFQEVIQLATPDCVRRRDMTLVRKLKDLQEYTERIEQLLDDAKSIIEDAAK